MYRKHACRFIKKRNIQTFSVRIVYSEKKKGLERKRTIAKKVSGRIRNKKRMLRKKKLRERRRLGS